ncbi:MAG: type II secretion system F family protein [Candidatus Aminicenantes bacterium]|nr:type II secretion system F family protein [Candidatus Aminicenantes bacterium]
MATYVWRGRNRFGDIVAGERVASSIEELSRALQREQITVIEIKPKRVAISIPFFRLEKVKLKDLSVFSRQLSVLIDAELPLIQSLNILAEQTKNRYFQRVIRTIRSDVEAGSTLNQAMRKHPKAFDDLYCNLIASGEQSGSLDIMLRRLAEYIEKIVRLRAKVRQAMIYPSAIITFAILVAIFLLWRVIPVFASIFTELGAELPFLTRIIIGASHFVQRFIILIILGLIALVILFRYYRRSATGRWTIDQLILRLPVVGPLMRKVAVSRFTRTLSTLVSGGVPMLESLQITATTAGNVIIEKAVLDARKMVAEGRSLNESLAETGQFPFMLTQMVSVGEATGTLDEMLAKLADFFDEEVDTAVAALLSVLEPLLIIFVGIMVGTLIISMYLPIFSLMAQF